MEQTNMMLNGLPQGGGGGGGGNPMASMQRPQVGNAMQQIHASIMDRLRARLPSLQGTWQATFDVRERAGKIMQLVTALRQINPDIGKCISIAEEWEKRVLTQVQNKDEYLAKMQEKMKEIQGRRQQQAAAMSLGSAGMMPQNMGNVHNGMQHMQNMQNMQSMQTLQNMQTMQNNGMGNSGFPPGQMNATPGQNPVFPTQLQRQMQPSPLPMQPQQQQPATMDPSALQMSSQRLQAQQQPQGINLGQVNGQVNGQLSHSQATSMGQRPQPQTNLMLQQAIEAAKTMYTRMDEDTKNQLRNKFANSLPEEQLALMRSKGQDPLLRLLVTRAQSQMQQKQQQNNAGMQNGMQMASSQSQIPPSQADGSGIDFSGILGQQANALKLQESGEQVVPASNNNSMGLGNQMNMPQNINPQMLGNQNGTAGQGQNASQNAQMQYYLQQRNEAQNSERMQKQLMAQQHAQQHAMVRAHSQLQGQPGGLHTPNAFGGNAPAQINSPAMSMLNRPIAPPGQGTPSTPQSNRPQQQAMPSTPMNGVSQLAQHHQSMVNQNNLQQQPGPTGPSNHPPHIMALLQRVPEQHREKLSRMPPAQIQAVLERFRTPGGGNRHPGQSGMANTGAQQQHQLQQQQQQPNQQQQSQQPNQPMPNMLQHQMSNAVPGFNSQPPPNQIHMDGQAQMQRRMQQQQHMAQRLRNQLIEQRPFPRDFLTQLSIAVPQGITTWGPLKQHIAQNSNVMPPGTGQKIVELQNRWFQSRPQELQQIVEQVNGIMASRMPQQNGQAMFQGPQQSTNPGLQPTAAGPDRPAPQAQMVPPAPMMQPPNQGASNDLHPVPPRQPFPPPGPQEIQIFRSKVPQAHNMTDEQIGQFMVRQKLEKLRQIRQGTSLQHNQGPRLLGQLSTGPQPNAPSADQQRAPQPAASQPSAGQQKPPPQTNNDIIEISSQPVQQNMTQASVMQASQPQPTLSGGSRLADAMRNMTDSEKQQYLQKMQRMQQQQLENIRKAQGQVSAPNNQQPRPLHPPPPQQQPGQSGGQDLQSRIPRLWTEMLTATKRGPFVQTDSATQGKIHASLKKLWNPLKDLQRTLMVAGQLGFDDNMLRKIIRARVIVHHNWNEETQSIRDGQPTVTLSQLQETERFVAGYMTEIKKRKEMLDARNAKGTSHASKPQPPAQPATMARTPSQSHVRKSSATKKAPPAPTDNQKTFDWTQAAPSPHGVPKYEPGRNELTTDKLKIPPAKKRRTDPSSSQASTPAAQAGSPAAGTGSAAGHGKIQSPDQVRKSRAQVKAESEREEEQKKFHCRDATCEASLKGFDYEDQLRDHTLAQHQKIDNALQYLLDNATTTFGVDVNNFVEQPVRRAMTNPTLAGEPSFASPQNRRKEELPTQVTEQPSRAVNPQATKDKDTRKLADVDSQRKDATKDETLRDTMMQKMDIVMPAEVTGEEVNVSSNDAPDLDSFLLGNESLGDELDAAVDWNRLIDTYEEGWIETEPMSGLYELRPGWQDLDSSPDLTPSEDSQSSSSSSSSDISQSDAVRFCLNMEAWNDDLFSDGLTGAPQSLVPIYHRIKGMLKDYDDTPMDGVEGEAKETETSSAEGTKKRKAEEIMTLPVPDIWDDFYDGKSSRQ
ncbi:hypothetical protein DOTSEDRAFT_68042 [Dothistroma septosporum NZE10]|uniref:Mediator complex subunit 15 KIX domain-containing protein n=1 Tax=Dothistroma septosporum (strain NZE10 / CBS 128990) TaxID=675120 RepID=N1Q0G4_DOTSN|nr:hypothetical protein DOTSEDRAFT_68042 [Dothistroma septosporum NZE10]